MNKMKEIDLTQLRVPALDIRNILLQVLSHGDKGALFALLESEKFEGRQRPGELRGLETAREKVLSGRLRALERVDYLVLFPYLVEVLGNDFLDVYAKMMETRLKNSLSGLSTGIMGHHEGQEKLVPQKIGLYAKQLNRELLLKWVMFLDHLPSLSRDESEEEMVRESIERIIDFFEKTTVSEETLKAQDWKILKNIIRYFGASRFFVKESRRSAGSYYGIIPYAHDSLTFGLSKSAMQNFLKKSVEEGLSVARPPVIKEDDLRPFLLNGREHYEVLSALEAYYRRLKEDMLGRRDVFKIFSIYYDAVAGAVSKARSGDDKMLRPEYLDSIYYAMNFEDFRNLNAQGEGEDLHTPGKWIRKMTAEHLGLSMHPLFLMPIQNLRSALSQKFVVARVSVTIEESLDEIREEKNDQFAETALAVEEEFSADVEGPEAELEGTGVVTPAETLEAGGPPSPPPARDAGEQGETSGEGAAEPAAPTPEMTAAPVLKPEVIRKNREGHVLPINQANILAMLVGNQPPGNFHKVAEKEEDE